MTTINITLYYYSSSAISNFSEFGLNLSLTYTQSVVQNTNNTVYKFDYTLENPIRFTTLNKLYNKFLNEYQNTFLPAVYSTSNRSTLQNLRYQYCFSLETEPDSYCDTALSNFNLDVNAPKQCSRIVSFESSNIHSSYGADTNYVLCREFQSILANPYGTDYSRAHTAYRTFCQQNPGAWDCQCYNRANDPIYTSLKKAAEGTSLTTHDKCWYVPCQSQTSVIVPDNIASDNANCPSVCANVILNVNVQEVNQNNLKLSNTCFENATLIDTNQNITSSPSKNYSEYTFNPVTKSPSTPTPKKNESSENYVYTTLAVLLIILLFLVCLSVLKYIIFNKKE